MVAVAATSALTNIALDPGEVNGVSDASMIPTNTASLVEKIKDASDLIQNVSGNYSFIKAISENIGAMDTATAMKTQQAMADFSYYTELTSKVASITSSGINALVKMQ